MSEKPLTKKQPCDIIHIDNGDRVERIIIWLRANAEDILNCSKGKVTFHFAGKDLEVEPSLKQKI